jgi:hypothetical protein
MHMAVHYIHGPKLPPLVRRDVNNTVPSDDTSLERSKLYLVTCIENKLAYDTVFAFQL